MAATDSTGLRRSGRRVTPGASLEKTLLRAAEDGTGEVIVDLTGCSFLDSKGLGALIATRGRLERANRRLALVLSNPSVMSIFRITHFDELFEIYPSLPAAVNGREWKLGGKG